MKAALGYVGLALLVCKMVTGCALFERAPAAATVTEYKAALDECRAEGKRRNSFAVYVQCANEADIRYGLSDDGGAP